MKPIIDDPEPAPLVYVSTDEKISDLIALMYSLPNGTGMGRRLNNARKELAALLNRDPKFLFFLFRALSQVDRENSGLKPSEVNVADDSIRKIALECQKLSKFRRYQSHLDLLAAWPKLPLCFSVDFSLEARPNSHAASYAGIVNLDSYAPEGPWDKVYV
jgi:hypothetical protein